MSRDMSYTPKTARGAMARHWGCRQGVAGFGGKAVGGVSSGTALPPTALPIRESGLKHRVADGLESGRVPAVAIPNQTVGNSVFLSPAPYPQERAIAPLSV